VKYLLMEMTDEKLLFIISQPRAGSTLTQKLLSNNSFVDTVSEPWLLLPVLSIYRPDLMNAKYNYPIALQALSDYLTKRGLEEGLRSGIKRLILDLYPIREGSKYFIDKSPRYYEILPQIIDLLPNARFIVLKRNPFAVLHSMISTWSRGKVDFRSMKGYCRDFLIAPFRIQEFCDRYGKCANVFVMNYESIVNEPRNSVKNAYSWLGIPFTDDVLSVGDNEKVKGIFGDDVYRKEPLRTIVAENASAWKKAVESDRRLLSFFKGYQDFLTRDFLVRYGYPDTTFDSPRLWLSKGFRDFIKLVGSDIDDVQVEVNSQ